MKTSLVIDTIRHNCQLPPATHHTLILNEINASLRKIGQRISLTANLTIDRTILATVANQTSFPLPSDVHYVDMSTLSFRRATSTDNWRLLQGRAEVGYTGEPKYAQLVGRNIVINANTISINDYLQFDGQIYPSVIDLAVEFPYPDLEQFVIEEVSAAIWAPTKSEMAESFMAKARNHWTGILSIYGQDQ